MEAFRRNGTIEGYHAVTPGCVITMPIEGIPVAVLIDPGATVSVMAKRMADLLHVAKRVPIQPSSCSAGVFDVNRSALYFAQKIVTSVGAPNNPHPFQIVDEMDLDCILGGDIASRLGLIIDYGKRVVISPWGAHPMMTRGQIVQALVSTDDAVRVANLPRQRHA
jgi:hypothetical protein